MSFLQDFSKSTSQGAIISGLIYSGAALRAGSAAMLFVGAMFSLAGYSGILFLDWCDCMKMCNQMDNEENGTDAIPLLRAKPRGRG